MSRRSIDSGLMASFGPISMDQDITSLESELSNIEDFVDRMRVQLVNSEGELKQVRQSFSTIEAEKNSIQCQFDSLKKKFDLLVEEKDQQSNLIERQRTAIKQLEVDLDSMRQRFFSALNAEKEALVARVKTQDETDKVIAQFNQKNSEMDQLLKVVLSQGQKQKETLTKTVEELSSQLQSANENLASKSERVSFLEEELGNLVDTKRLLESAQLDLEKVNEELASKNTQIASLQQQMSDSVDTKTSLARARQEIGRLQQQKNALQAQYERCKKNYDEVISKLYASNQQIEVKNKQIEKKNQQITELQKEIDLKNERIVSLQKRSRDAFHDELESVPAPPSRFVEYLVEKKMNKRDKSVNESINLEPLQMFLPSVSKLNRRNRFTC